MGQKQEAIVHCIVAEFRPNVTIVYVLQWLVFSNLVYEPRMGEGRMICHRSSVEPLQRHSLLFVPGIQSTILKL